MNNKSVCVMGFSMRDITINYLLINCCVILTCEKQQSTCYQRQEVDEVEGPAPTLTLPSLALYSPGILPTAMQV